MGKLCQLFGRTRQAWYDRAKRDEFNYMQDMLVLEEVRKIRKRLPRLGTEKLHYLLKDFLLAHHIKMGRDKLYDLLREYGLLPSYKRRRAYTTNSRHYFYKYPNIIKDIIPDRPNMIWVSDITYIPMVSGFSYLSLITDTYSHKIVGWHLSSNMETEGPGARQTS
jgi:transposase InsO family protein